jgi:predicted esterase
VELQPKLIEVRVPDEPQGVVVVLHGGASRRENMMVSPTQLSVLRMIPIAKRIARAGKGDLAVFRLLNSRRGWDTSHTPVHDAEWALGRIRDRLGGEVPICLVGHSLGGRAAILASGSPEVRCAVALAPYVYPSDVPPIHGQRVVIIHGSGDRIASPARAIELAQRLAPRTPTGFVLVRGGKHAMLRRHGDFSGLAADFATHSLLGRARLDVTRRVAGGEFGIEI